MEEPHRRDVDILGWGVGGGFVRVELLSGVVPRDRKSVWGRGGGGYTFSSFGTL